MHKTACYVAVKYFRQYKQPVVIVIIQVHCEVYEIYKPEAVAHEHSEGTTKNLRVYKFHRLDIFPKNSI